MIDIQFKARRFVVVSLTSSMHYRQILYRFEILWRVTKFTPGRHHHHHHHNNNNNNNNNNKKNNNKKKQRQQRQRPPPQRSKLKMFAHFYSLHWPALQGTTMMLLITFTGFPSNAAVLTSNCVAMSLVVYIWVKTAPGAWPWNTGLQSGWKQALQGPFCSCW